MALERRLREWGALIWEVSFAADKRCGAFWVVLTHRLASASSGNAATDNQVVTLDHSRRALYERVMIFQKKNIRP
jgi:hypothetical protein